MLNKIFLQGRLVADPELRRTSNGVAVATFRLAVDRDFKSKNPDEPTADFIDIVAWRSSAEFVSRYFNKGKMALVEGRLQIRSYTDRDGIRRKAAEVVADSIHFCDSKRESEGYSGGNTGYSGGNTAYSGGYNNSSASPYAPPSASANSSSLGSNEFAELSEDDGELPF